MAAKGSMAKEQVTAQILQTFNGAFRYDKEIRIPVMENGELVQIKVALTCAKNLVDAGEGASPFNGDGAAITQTAAFPTSVAAAPAQKEKVFEPTQEEVQNLSKLLESLGIEV